MVGERLEPFTEGRKAIAVRAPLLFLPARSDPELETSPADDIDRRRQLRGEGRVPETGADDHVPEPDPARRHSERGQRRERLEGDLVGRGGNGVEVVEDPEVFETEVVRLAGERHSPRPRLGGLPAVVLALPALRGHQTDLHTTS